MRGQDCIQERVRCGGLFSGFMITSSSSSSSSPSNWVASNQNEGAGCNAAGKVTSVVARAGNGRQHSEARAGDGSVSKSDEGILGDMADNWELMSSATWGSGSCSRVITLSIQRGILKPLHPLPLRGVAEHPFSKQNFKTT
ncbi:hypothetical protein R6Q57_011471 [Mikania cordata]